MHTTEQLEHVNLQLEQKKRWCAQLETALKLAQAVRFGRKTEAFSADQLSLLNEDVESDIVDLQEKIGADETSSKPAPKPKRIALPESLERVSTTLKPDYKDCPSCGGELRHLRDELIRDRPPDKRRQWRQRYAKPHLEEMYQWLLMQHSRVPPNSGIHKAIGHGLRRWLTLLVYLNNGAIPIDNNHIENCIRPIALGRKNWLFAGSLMAGQRMAGLLSLLHTAKQNGIDPYVWLNFVLTNLPTWKNNRLDELMLFAENDFS